MSSSRAATLGDAASVRVADSRRPIAVVIAVVFLDVLGFGITIPILPVYVRSFGASDVFNGLLAASYSLPSSALPRCWAGSPTNAAAGRC